MKRLFILVFLITLLSTTNGILAEASSSDKETYPENRPNIIYMIGDGMGPEQVKLASLVEYGIENGSIMDTFPYKDTYKTNAINGETTDSAAGGTALASGQRTKNKVIGMDPDKNYYYKNILEYLSFDFGYSTGVVTNMEFAHATPASFSSHVKSRDYTDKIKAQMLNKDIDIILGSGLDVSYVGGESNARSLGSTYGYDVAVSKSELQDLDHSSDKLLGLFPGFSTPYELERDDTISPSIIDMTESALTFLKNQDNPYFVMIEAGLIDYSGHLSSANVNRTLYNAMETIMFEKAIRYAYDVAVEDGNTILIVDADHETGGLQVLDYTNLSDELPCEDCSRLERNAQRIDRVANISVSWYWTAHTDTEVPIYMYGADFGPVSWNVDVFWELIKELGSFPVILSHSYELSSESVAINVKIRDLDTTMSEAVVYIEYEDKTISDSTFEFDQTTANQTYDFTVPFDKSKEMTNIYFKIVDQGIYDVYGFDYHKLLIGQDVTRSVIEISEPSEESDSPYYALGLVTLLLYPIMRRRISYKI